MTRSQLVKARTKLFQQHQYRMAHFSDFDYSILKQILYITRRGKGAHDRYADCIIMADTETSKKHPNDYKHEEEHGKTVKKLIPVGNHVVAWTISIRAYGCNIVTLWGSRPSDMINTLSVIRMSIDCDKLLIYFHNLSYDWVFLRQFCFATWGRPQSQLNTKPHYPISISFLNGIIFRDSLILAQRSLDKWASDMNTEHQKAVGKWDYDKIRNQTDSKEAFSIGELEYIEHDTLCGVECIDAMMKEIHKSICHMPYTATGVVRDEVFKMGQANKAKDTFDRQHLTYNQYINFTDAYHGGYTHTNRHEKNKIHGTKENPVKPFDFASSYPYCMIAFDEYAIEKFFPVDNMTINDILAESDYLFRFRLIGINVRLKNPNFGMPVLQFSKCKHTFNAVTDNGRLLKADMIDIPLLSIDLELIAKYYDFDKALCIEVECAKKGALPRWLTDYVYHMFELKTQLKGGDPVAYSIAKAKLNSIYGMTVQRSIRPDIKEDYDTGEYTIKNEESPEEQYEKYLKNFKSILPYSIGCVVTSLALRNLFKLGECAGKWIYSDTDSCYGMDWDMEAVNRYNDECKQRLQAKGYGAVMHNGKEYWLGVAEEESSYYQFKAIHAKCYAGIYSKDNEIHITVAGVPKRGRTALKSLDEFTDGFVFPGSVTGKKLHTYFFTEMYIDENGNETADSIDLTPCDYIISDKDCLSWRGEDLDEQIKIQVYEGDNE